MEEEWRDIEGFPTYQVSNRGHVWSKRSELRLSQSQNEGGVAKVNLVRDGGVFTRSVKVLVAEAFVAKFHEPPNVSQNNGDPENTPINLDGDPTNNCVENLAWRPRWFAWKYARQFHEDIPVEYHVKVINETTGGIYDSVMEAGIADGVLWEYIYQSILSGRPVYPTGSIYDFLFD